MSSIDGEILLALWKIHILHHAALQPVYGQWISDELRRHGYAISPGTLYPLLARMESQGWLSVQVPRAAGAKARRNYVLTRTGARALVTIRRQVEELHRELSEATEERSKRPRARGGRSASDPRVLAPRRGQLPSSRETAPRSPGRPRRETSK
jgi:PadR family transcriptional regulator, regulatory protein PadR